MNTWHPVTIHNSKIDGEAAAVSSVMTWQRLDWLHAEARAHPTVPAIVAKARNHATGKNARLYFIAPDRSALGLAAGERIVPVFIPDSPPVRSNSAHGWIWLLADHQSPTKPTNRAHPAFPKSIP